MRASQKVLLFSGVLYFYQLCRMPVPHDQFQLLTLSRHTQLLLSVSLALAFLCTSVQVKRAAISLWLSGWLILLSLFDWPLTTYNSFIQAISISLALITLSACTKTLDWRWVPICLLCLYCRDYLTVPWLLVLTVRMAQLQSKSVEVLYIKAFMLALGLANAVLSLPISAGIHYCAINVFTTVAISLTLLIQMIPTTP